MFNSIAVNSYNGNPLYIFNLNASLSLAWIDSCGAEGGLAPDPSLPRFARNDGDGRQFSSLPRFARNDGQRPIIVF